MRQHFHKEKRHRLQPVLIHHDQLMCANRR